MRIPLTQGKYALVDKEDYGWLMQWKWCYKQGYAARSQHLGYKKTNGKWARKCIFMHRAVVGGDETLQVDHINRDKLDNRRSNLRLVTRSQNQLNVMKKNFRSGVPGVHWRPAMNKWRAVLWSGGRENKKMLNIGHFEKFEDAVKARKEALSQRF